MTDEVPHIFTAQQLQSMELPVAPAVVPGMVYQGHMLLAGKPKMGKSWLCLQIALSVARGMPVFNATPHAAEVLYLALEDNALRMNQRLELLCGTDAEWPRTLHIATSCPRMGDGGIEQIAGWVASHPRCKLVIVDMLARLRPLNDKEYSYRADYAVGAELSRLANAAEIAVLSVHHLKKARADDPLDEISGSTGLSGAVDGIMTFTRPRLTGPATLYVTGRDIEDSYELVLNGGPGKGWVVDPLSTRAATRERDEVLQMARANGFPWTIKELYQKNQPAISFEAFRQRVGRMVHDGELIVVGGSKRNGGYEYAIPPGPMGPVAMAFPPDGVDTLDHKD